MDHAVKSFQDRRRDTRFPTSFRAFLRWGNRLVRVALIDIANHGLRFCGPEVPDVGTMVRVGAKGLDTRGYVMWRVGNLCGVRLVRPINALAVVRANCFPLRYGLPDRRPPDGLPDWVNEDMLSDLSAGVVAAGSPRATVSRLARRGL